MVISTLAITGIGCFIMKKFIMRMETEDRFAKANSINYFLDSLI